MNYLDILSNLEFWLGIYAVVLSIVSLPEATKKVFHLWRTRHLRKVWGIGDGEVVTVVCSELEDPAERQWVQPREFIYSLKYGDVDAFFDVVVTLLRLYPAIRLRVMSGGEVEQTRLNLAGHLVLIGGPDYNGMASYVIDGGTTQFAYRSPDAGSRSTQHPDEIVIYDKVGDREYCCQADTKDFGYFESIVNPHNPESRIVLIGGCHTIGVTGAVKAFSMADSEYGETPRGVLRNAALVARRIGKAKAYSVVVSAELVGQTIGAPVVKEENVTVRS